MMHHVYASCFTRMDGPEQETFISSVHPFIHHFIWATTGYRSTSPMFIFALSQRKNCSDAN